MAPSPEHHALMPLSFSVPEAIRALKFIFLVPGAGSASGTNESEQTVRKRQDHWEENPANWEEYCFVRQGGGTEEGLRGPRVLSEGTGCQKPSPGRAGTSAVKGAPSIAKRNSLTQKSRAAMEKDKGAHKNTRQPVFSLL